jgi:hypothetical protein
MSTIRLKKVRNLLVNWFQSHDLVNSAKFGDFVQMYMSEQIQHSCVVIDLIRVPELTRSKIGYQFVFTYADRMFADRRNETDIKNDCVRVFHDFVIAASNDIELRKYITGLTTGNIEIFSQRSGDLVAGGVMTVSINIISDQDKCAIPITPIPTPPPPTCADVIIQLNQVTTFTLPSGATQNINLLDENDQQLEVIDVDGDDVTLATLKGREILKTGQTTSYRTGDDGDLQEGRDVDFFTLDFTNPFGNTNRFTDELGGQNYVNNWVIDWSTYDGSTVLGVYRISIGAFNWNDGIDNAISLTYGTFSNCRLINIREVTNFTNFGLTSVFNYSPLNLNIGFFTSSIWQVDTNRPFVASPNGLHSVGFRTDIRQNIAVRTFTVTGTTLT